MPLDVAVDIQLRGLAEETADDSVWITKTHFPMNMPKNLI